MITRWIKNLFENKKARKKHTRLSKQDVQTIRNNINVYNRETICEYFNISRSTYYEIKKGEHRHQRSKK